MDGLLVDPDDPPAIAEAILRLLADDNLAARLGEAGHRRVVDRFAIDTLLAENEAFFAQAIERFRAGA
jgi:glycosyltransferase involved in cell wall biosynthesis